MTASSHTHIHVYTYIHCKKAMSECVKFRCWQRWLRTKGLGVGIFRPPRRLVRATDVHIGISRSFFYSVQYSLCITVLHSLTDILVNICETPLTALHTVILLSIVNSIHNIFIAEAHTLLEHSSRNLLSLQSLLYECTVYCTVQMVRCHMQLTLNASSHSHIPVIYTPSCTYRVHTAFWAFDFNHSVFSDGYELGKVWSCFHAIYVTSLVSNMNFLGLEPDSSVSVTS
jgi:hypothetical protein